MAAGRCGSLITTTRNHVLLSPPPRTRAKQAQRRSVRRHRCCWPYPSQAFLCRWYTPMSHGQCAGAARVHERRPDPKISDHSSHESAVTLPRALRSTPARRLAARGESPAAFERRCIPAAGVASRSNTGRYSPSARLVSRVHRHSRCAAGHHHRLLDGDGSRRRLIYSGGAARMAPNSAMWPSTTRRRASSSGSSDHTPRCEVPPRAIPSARGIMWMPIPGCGVMPPEVR